MDVYSIYSKPGRMEEQKSFVVVPLDPLDREGSEEETR